MTAKIRLGLVGLGLASAATAPALRASNLVSVVGAADLNPVLRSRFEAEFGVGANANVEDLVRRDDVDAVYIATPHQFHKDHAVLAAHHGKHMIVEKPMALMLTECDDMIAAAEAASVQLIVGHTHSFDAPIRLMRDIIASGELGRVAMITSLSYTDFLYRPRRPEELDTARGGGIFFNQIPHQVDIVRLLAGSDVRSVRATAAVLDNARPTEGSCAAILDFESGASASLIYSGYDHFDSDEFHGWVGETGQPKQPRHGQARAALKAMPTPEDERRARWDLYGFGGANHKARNSSRVFHQPHFGTTIVTCEGGDLRQSADGVLIYSDSGVREVFPTRAIGHAGREAVLDEFYQAVVNHVAPLHNGHFARRTIQVSLAMLQSSRERREIRLSGTES
jgi:phthalate 4,5-cis-dihydrodiol dehydrogenase